MKRKLFLFASAAALFLAVSCNKAKNDDPNTIRVGVQAGPEFVVAQEAQKIAKEKYGLNVELVQFNDFVMPNTALEEKDIDVNAFQHKPYLDDQIKERGYKLVAVGKTFVYPMAGFSNKIKSLDELADGSVIAIPNDATNGGRALLLLQQKGLIKLKDPNSLIPKPIDIVENPKKLEIKEMEAPSLPRNLDDKSVAVAIINNTYAAKSGLTLDKALFIEDKDSPYVNLIVAREDNKDEEKVKNFVNAYQTDEVVKVATETFKGGLQKGW